MTTFGTVTTYDYLQPARVTGVFTDPEDGSPIDPGTVTFYCKLPDGTELEYVYPTDPELVKEAVGTYYVDLANDQVGPWQYTFQGTGNNPGSMGDAYVVLPDPALP